MSKLSTCTPLFLLIVIILSWEGFEAVPDNSIVVIPISNGTEPPVKEEFIEIVRPRFRGSVSHPRPSSPEEAKFVVNIVVEDLHVCSGAYIQNTWVVTVAHCLTVFSVNDFHFVMGSLHSSGKGGQKRNAVNVVTHPKYNNKMLMFDIALVQLEKPFDQSATVGTVPVAPTIDVDAKPKCHLQGWGLSLGIGETLLPDSGLERISVTLTTTAACEKYYDDGFTKVDSTVVCAGEDVDLSMVDAGATLVCNDQVVGCVTIPGGHSRSPSIFINMAYFNVWIEDNVIFGEHSGANCLVIHKERYCYFILFLVIFREIIFLCIKN